jgi:DNA-binding Xre family transcriptional regulator
MTPELQMKRRLRVKELLAERHMGMATLARRGWLALRTVKQICRNPFHPAKEVTLAKIAATLGVPVSDLFEDVPDQNL